jgi:hypothetical protein
MAKRPRLPGSPRLDRHIQRVRRVNPDYDVILIDFWAPSVVDQLTRLRRGRGRLRKILGEIDGYTAAYWKGRDLAVEMEVLETESGRRILQDGSHDARILTALSARLEAKKSEEGRARPAQDGEGRRA